MDAAPATTIDSGPADGETVPGPDVSFSFSSAAADLSGFECDLDGAGYAPCSSPTDLTALADGPHAFAVRAIDATGNVEAAPPSRNFVVDSSLAGGPAPVQRCGRLQGRRARARNNQASSRDARVVT